ncbi:MAG: OFA family MFS transporter [gamma proteobacterium endosymbiont of Lamellibrachia anaximandri]|nr:OFA family MFS transporter [gamma proteobacterium endosymbiont of Lamellibrachia anaximandri]MBL3535035.1 OFA family MFS transporter [gamma proteobacterium endosymbiont of Lamellibrachia anaximandri]
MSSSKSRHGMWVIFGALLIQLSLGAIYAWSVFAKPLQVSGWSTSDTQWPFTVGLVAFALVMVYAGRKLYVFGPRKLTAAGGIMLGAGYLLAGVMGGESFWPTLIGAGLLGGAGIGLGYVVPIAVGMQWFPDKKGLITGVAVAGFGLGAMIWVKLAGTWGGLIADYGIGTTFMIYGGIFMVLVLIGSLWMRFPPEFVPPKPDHKGSKFDFRSEEMIRTTHYWSIFSTFAIGATAGLMCIGLMKQFPSQALTASGMAETLADATAGTAMVVFAIFNALGRIGWGKISDIIGHAVNCDHRGRKTSLIIMAASQGLFVIAFPYVAGFEYSLYLFAALIGFNFGGNFALFPAITTDTFGHKFFGQNYGYVFLAYGLGGTVGPMLGGYLGDMNNYRLAFVITGVLSLIAAVIISTVKIPMKPQAEDVTIKVQASGTPSTVTAD